MSVRVVFRSAANIEVIEAFWWYEQSRTGLGKLFLDQVDDALLSIQKNPKAFQNVHKNFRQIPLNKFPFVILYKEYSEEIVIYAVFHTSRQPQKKFRK